MVSVFRVKPLTCIRYMSDTVESIHNKITDKIAGLKRTLECIREAARFDPGFRSPVNLIADDIAVIEHAYNFATIDILTRYYETSQRCSVEYDDDSEDARAVLDMIREIDTYIASKSEKPNNPYVQMTPNGIVKQYYRVITAENFIARINEMTVYIKGVLDSLHGINNENVSSLLERARKALSQVSNLDIQLQVKRSNYEYCSRCSVKMEVIPISSEMKCPKCNRIKTLYGTVFEDHQFYNQEGQKTKHGTYDPNRHFRFWMDRIQAKERMDFPQDMLDKIESTIRRYYSPPIVVNCIIMRDILKDTKLTRYNDHIPLLVKRFTGTSPPQLTHNEMRTFAIKFNKIMEIYEQIVKQDRDGNRPYYPYFIYKIAEDEFKDNPEKLKILDYIHLQSDDTIIKHDLIYRQICDNAPDDAGLVYRTTDSTERRV